MKHRIAMISEHASPLAAIGNVDSGGQNVYVANVALQMASEGYLVDVYTRRDNPTAPTFVEWMPGVRVINVPVGPPAFVRKEDLLGLMPDFAAWMADFIRQRHIHYSLLHPNFWTSGVVAMRLKERFHTPFVITFHALGKVRRQHQGDSDEFPQIREAVEKEIVEAADAVVAECPQDKTDLMQLYGCDETKIAIIPCGFDPAEMNPVNKSEARAFLNLPKDERIVLQLGRMVPRKGVDLVIRGLAHLGQEHGIRARLVIVGGDLMGMGSDIEEVARLKRVAEDCGVSDQVVFTGRRDRNMLRYFYSAADVFVTVPWYEPFGITPLEAMACGTPVIGADVGGISYTVQHGQTGLLVPPRNFRSVGNALAILFRDPTLLACYGEAGRRHVQKNFTWEQVGAHMSQLYASIVGASLNKRRRYRRNRATSDKLMSPH
jgi:D-inositol-3-phosphate glycosyltransferase